MSVFRKADFHCPACGTTNVEEVAASLHGPRAPEAVEAIRAGTFQQFTCRGCQRPYRADGPLIYTDFDDKVWIGVFPESEEGAWSRLENQALDAFRSAVVDHAPRFLRQEADGFRIRTVFGLPALAAKLALFQFDWDDHLVETARLDAMVSGFGLVHPAHRPVLAHADADRIVWQIDLPHGDFQVERARATVESMRGVDHWSTFAAELHRGTYVDVGRVLMDGAATSRYDGPALVS